MSTTTDLEAELHRLQRELERRKLEEQIHALENQLQQTKTAEAEELYEEVSEYDEEILEDDHQVGGQAMVQTGPSNQNTSISATEQTPKKTRGVGSWFGSKTTGPSKPSSQLSSKPVINASRPLPEKKTSSAEPLPAQPFAPRVISRDIEPSQPGQETPLELLLGSCMYAGGKLIKRSTKACLDGQNYLLLYFGSSWNRECKAFFPALLDFYRTISQKYKMEAIYISHDRSLQDFKEIFTKMPFPAMPTGTSELKNTLAKNLKAIEVPTVAILDVASGGKVITTHAVQDIAALQRNSVEEATALMETYQSITPISFNEVMMDSRLKHGKLERGTLYWQA